MTNSFRTASNADRFEELLASHLDGHLSEAKLAEFFQLLAEKPERCHELMAFTWQARLIHSWLQPELSPDAEQAGVRDQGSGVSAEVPTSEVQISKSPLLGFLSRTSAVLSKPVLWSVLGVGLVFFGYVAVISWGIRDHSPLAPGGGGLGGEGAVATILDDESRSNATSSQGIQSGMIELELNAGTKLSIEGPADWSVDGDNSVSLRSGKLLARVPAHAIGFTVETPTAKVVDLGTEFGVVADKDGKTDIHVLRGSVEVKRSHTEGKESNRAVRLSAGSALRVSAAQQPAMIPFDSNQFAAALKSISQSNGTDPATGKKLAASRDQRASLPGSLRVGNFSFESPVLAEKPFDGTIPPFWEGAGAVGMIGASHAVPTDGVQAVFLGTAANLPAKLYQRFADPKPNTTYTLTVDVVPRTDNLLAGSTGYIELWEGLPGDGSLLAANRTIVQPDLAAGPQTYTVSGTTGNTIRGDLAIVLGYSGSGTQVVFDNVRISTSAASKTEPPLNSDKAPP